MTNASAMGPILHLDLDATGEPVRSLSDDQLRARFRNIGRAHKELKRALMGMLGELDRRGIPRRAGYTSLFEYAEREGGLERSQIELALRLDRALQGLTHLRRLFEQGQAFPNRLRVVLGIVCPELDEELAGLVQRLSKAELEVWVRDWKDQQRQRPGAAPDPTPPLVDQAGIPWSAPDSASVPGVPPRTVSAPSTAATGTPAPAQVPMPLPAQTAAILAAQTPGVDPAQPQASAAKPADHATDSPAPSPAPPAPAEASARTSVWIQISVVNHQRLLHEQARLAGLRGRTVSLDEVHTYLLTGEDASRARYNPVITTTPDGEPLALRTPGGEVPVTREDLAGLHPACPPIDLEKELVGIQAQLPAGAAPSRTRPASVERYLQARSGGCCEADGCGHVGMVVQHWRPWRTDRRHDPAQMSVLCAAHAALADRGLLVRDAAGRTQVVATPPPGGEARVRAVQERFEEERERAIQRKAGKKLAGAIVGPSRGEDGPSVPGRAATTKKARGR